MSFAFDDERAAMSADVRQAPELRVVIGCDDERFVEAPLEQREREHVTRGLHPPGVCRPLPTFREDILLLELEVARVGIDAGWEGRGGADIGVDLDAGKGRAGHCTVEITLSERNFQYAGSY